MTNGEIETDEQGSNHAVLMLKIATKVELLER